MLNLVMIGSVIDQSDFLVGDGVYLEREGKKRQKGVIKSIEQDSALVLVFGRKKPVRMPVQNLTHTGHQYMFEE